MAAPRDGGTDHLLKSWRLKISFPMVLKRFIREYADQRNPRCGRRDRSADSQIELKSITRRVDWDTPLTLDLGGVGLLNVGYAYTEIEADSDRGRSSGFLQRVGGFYVNGRGYQGEPYSATISGRPYLYKRALTGSLLEFAGKH